MTPRTRKASEHAHDGRGVPPGMETVVYSWRGHSGARGYYLLPCTMATVGCMRHLNLASTSNQPPKGALRWLS